MAKNIKTLRITILKENESILCIVVNSIELHTMLLFSQEDGIKIIFVKLFGTLIKHCLLFVIKVLGHSQIYFNSVFNSATIRDACRIFNKEGHFQNALYFPSFWQPKSDYPEQLNICTKERQEFF